MITEQDLEQAIAECHGARNPNANTCYKLAAFMYLRKELFGHPEQAAYSFSAGPEPVDTRIDYKSDTEFSQAIDGRDAAEVWPVMDEMMSVIQTMVPKLYDSVLRKLRE